jgi:hypothetical protein
LSPTTGNVLHPTTFDLVLHPWWPLGARLARERLSSILFVHRPYEVYDAAR